MKQREQTSFPALAETSGRKLPSPHYRVFPTTSTLLCQPTENLYRASLAAFTITSHTLLERDSVLVYSASHRRVNVVRVHYNLPVAAVIDDAVRVGLNGAVIEILFQTGNPQIESNSRNFCITTLAYVVGLKYVGEKNLLCITHYVGRTTEMADATVHGAKRNYFNRTYTILTAPDEYILTFTAPTDIILTSSNLSKHTPTKYTKNMLANLPAIDVVSKQLESETRK